MTLAEMIKSELPHRFWNKRWHLVSGCTECSPGCANCWLRVEANMRQHNPHESIRQLHEGLLTEDSKQWNGTIRCNEHLLDLPLRRRKPTTWVIWSDLFHEAVSGLFRDRAFNRMSSSERHHFIIITKRPHLTASFLREKIGRDDSLFGFQKWPLSNVTILVTMEDQKRVDERAPYAHLISSMGWRVGALCEPLLGEVDLSKWLGCKDPVMPAIAFDWVITGGESGAKARPTHPKAFRLLRDQAKAAGIPFLFKGWGEWAPFVRVVESGQILEREIGDGKMARLGKSEAGNSLDGQTWLQVPEI